MKNGIPAAEMAKMKLTISERGVMIDTPEGLAELMGDIDDAVASSASGPDPLGEPVLIGRTKAGRLFALRDICPHRAAPLSAGRIVD
jgi:hypothetical protein